MKKNLFLLLFLFVFFQIIAQEEISTKDLQKYTQHFNLSDDNTFNVSVAAFFKNEANNNQFIGIAEVHQSQQLSRFTSALLKIIKDEGYSNLALELGAHSTEIIESFAKDPKGVKENLKLYNNTYGKNSFPFIPFIFADKVGEANFIEEASKTGYNLWGIDREYEFSYVMHLDELYRRVVEKTPEITKAYKKCRSVIDKVLFKNKISGKAKLCWLKDEPNTQAFFSLIDSDETLANYINEIKNSWEIYCRVLTGKGGSSLRARYMRKKFDSLYTISKNGDNKLPKVLVKLGGVHLTHGNSQYGRFDVGRHLHEKAKENKTGFLSIRHVWRYKNGKDQVGKKGWERTSFLMQMGKKDKWTLIDLRPLKKKLKSGEISVDKGTQWELQNYDLFLISPNDEKDKINR